MKGATRQARTSHTGARFRGLRSRGFQRRDRSAGAASGGKRTHRRQSRTARSDRVHTVEGIPQRRSAGGSAPPRRCETPRRIRCSRRRGCGGAYRGRGINLSRGTTPGLGSIGSRRSRPDNCSNSAAACSSAASPRGLPTSCRPTGRPYWSKPHGTAIAGQAGQRDHRRSASSRPCSCRASCRRSSRACAG